MKGSGVGRDIVAFNPAPAGDGAHQPAFLVGETHRHAVDLRLDDVDEFLACEELHQPLMEGPEFSFGIRVVQALHRLAMAIGRKPLQSVVADTARRRIRRLEFRKLRFEVRQLPFQPVIFEVGDLRPRLPVIQFVMPGHLDPEVRDALCGLG